MPKKRSSLSQDYGSYLWRGGQKIAVEKELDRFTVMPNSPQQLEKLSRASGVKNIQPITNQVFKIETTAIERDATMTALRSAAFNAIVHHAYRPQNSEGTMFYLTDKIIVKFKETASIEEIDKLIEKYALKFLKEYEEQGKTYLLQVTATSKENPLKVANRLADEGIVDFAEPNMVNRFQPAYIPTDNYFSRQWHLNASAGVQLLAEASVMAPKAWDITRGDRNIVVAVVDDGFDLTHPDFKGVGKVVFPRDYVDGDAKPFPDSLTGDYHGTPCAGVAIAESNGRGVVGIAHGCAFMPVRFPLSADDDLLSEIFTEVGSKADIISCSWGPPPVYAPLSPIVTNLFNRLTVTGGPRGKGCVICFAAGNNNAPISDASNANGFIWRDSSGLQRRTSGPILSGFAAHPDIIAVAASTSLNKHSSYSNWGKEISVSAPSNNFHPLDRNKVVPGRGIFTTDNEAFGQGFTARSRFTGDFGGTSSATPLLAGVAALVLSANPQLSAAEVKEILQKTADKIVDSDPDIILGTNRGIYDGRGHCDWFGFGKVNAQLAVLEAKRRRTS